MSTPSTPSTPSGPFTPSPADISWLDQSDAMVTANVRRYGIHITFVGSGCARPGCTCEDSGPAFAYTTGYFGLNHPELLMFGPSATACGRIFNELLTLVIRGQDLLPGQLVDLAELDVTPAITDMPLLYVEQVPNPGEIVFEANRFYQRPREASVPVYQLTRCDNQHRFPWDDGCTIPLSEQPRPGTFRA